MIVRTDAEAAALITSDVDERYQPFIISEHTKECCYHTKDGIAWVKAYASFADSIWVEASTPDLDIARKFSEVVKDSISGLDTGVKLLVVVQLKQHLDDSAIPKFKKEFIAMGFKCQSIPLIGFHALNYSMFDLTYDYAAQADYRLCRVTRARVSC
nr:hypothetical protein [Mycobacterium uberis]